MALVGTLAGLEASATGGIHIHSTSAVHLLNTTIEANRATAGFDGQGGGVAVDVSGTLKLEGYQAASYINASNGVVYLVGGVLMPPNTTAPEFPSPRENSAARLH